MNSKDYFASAQTYPTLRPEDFSERVSVTLITNFTDSIIEKLLIGLCLEHHIYPEIYRVPYKQYDLFLADSNSELYTRQSDITFVFFDATPFVHSRFVDKDDAYGQEVLETLRTYIDSRTSPVIVHTLPTPYHGPYGNLFAEEAVYGLVKKYNEALVALQTTRGTMAVCDTDRLFHQFGEGRARDLRNHHAFDIPFSNDFSLVLVREWFSYITHSLGRIKKCIVVDLDNTLWGGVVGELGARGINLGPEYPGLAFQNFQRALLRCRDRGILLAINSKNNASDVDEVFAQNPHMILQKKHFAAIRTNWDHKADNLVSIAKELNIGVDSLVFIDDDPFQREQVREALPQVLIPDYSVPPEAYVTTLFSLPIFTQFRLTAEDTAKNAMYQEERQREAMKVNTVDSGDYIAKLGLTMTVRINAEDWIPRLSQLTLKTNQFNVTTRRYTEEQIRQYMKIGRVYAADVSDRFGNYGITIMAIVTGLEDTAAQVDTFLMSCRVMGRGIEQAFFRYLVKDLVEAGVQSLVARFIPTAKNEPAKGFFPGVGMREMARDNEGDIEYTLPVSLDTFSEVVKPPITIISSQ